MRKHILFTDYTDAALLVIPIGMYFAAPLSIPIGATQILLLALSLLIGLKIVKEQVKPNRASIGEIVNPGRTESQLRSAFSPHFIFNSLNSIQSLILEERTPDALNYLLRFSKLMRVVMEQSLKSEVSLESEIGTLQAYLELEKMRKEGGFNFTFDFDDSLDIHGILIPPLLLQPLVENAIWHGFNELSNKGELKISFYESRNILFCEIRDNGIGRKAAMKLRKASLKSHKGRATEILKERMKSIGGEMEIIDLKNKRKEALGTLVSVSIPLN